MQPYVALGAGLREAGHEVTLVTGKGFEAMASGRDLRYVDLDVDLLELAASQQGKVALRSPIAHSARGARAPAHHANDTP